MPLLGSLLLLWAPVSKDEAMQASHRSGKGEHVAFLRDQKSRGLLRQLRLQALADETDISDLGEANFPKYVAGGDDNTGGTSWIAGAHREPMWSMSQTNSCGDTWPCVLGKADQGHFFQREENPYVDKRMV